MTHSARVVVAHWSLADPTSSPMTPPHAAGAGAEHPVIGRGEMQGVV